jgi:hypothetical protein
MHAEVWRRNLLGNAHFEGREVERNKILRWILVIWIKEIVGNVRRYGLVLPAWNFRVQFRNAKV